MRKISSFLLILTVIALASCSSKPYVGRYNTRHCILLEYIQLYPDYIAELKYMSIADPAAAPYEVLGEDTIIIKEINREWYFRYRGDTLYELTRNDANCFLVKPSPKK